MFRLIATWKMSLEGVAGAALRMGQGEKVDDAVTRAVRFVEDEPEFSSVGFGGLPALDGHVYCDAAFMDGNSLRCGAILSAEGIRNPVDAARLLCGRETDCVLAGRGAEQFALNSGLPMRDMRTKKSMKRWQAAVAEKNAFMSLGADRGHDTVCVLGLGEDGWMVSATSTSGLFMKEPGRVGDSPLIGSGFYCDSRFGAAAATGLGEDIMRGCLSFRIVSEMRNGKTPAQACREAVLEMQETKKRLGESDHSISVIALSPDGSFGAATTCPVFPFAVGSEEGTVLYVCRPDGEGGMLLRPAEKAEIENEP